MTKNIHGGINLQGEAPGRGIEGSPEQIQRMKATIRKQRDFLFTRIALDPTIDPDEIQLWEGARDRIDSIRQQRDEFMANDPSLTLQQAGEMTLQFYAMDTQEDTTT